MSDYAKVKLEVTYSSNSDYSDPDFKTVWPDFELTPDEGEVSVVEALTSGTTLTTSTKYSSLTNFAVVNLDKTNYVTITWTDNGSNANTQRVPAKSFLLIPDINAATNPVITANSATVRCKVAMTGT